MATSTSKYRAMTQPMLLFMIAVACWPSIPSLYQRWLSPGGWWPGAVLFLAATGYWLFLLVLARSGSSGRNQHSRSCAPIWMLLVSACVIAHAFLHSLVPNLVSCGLIMLGVGCCMLGTLAPETRRGCWGIVPVLGLSLHVEPSLQFFLGYPLRQVVGTIAAVMLGQTIQVAGGGLTDGIHMVFVDAPCSGVRMLSTSLLFASILSLVLRLSPGRTSCLIALGGVAAVLGNALRAASLFLLETRTSVADHLHAPVGIAAFIACALGLAWSALLFQRQVRAELPATRHIPKVLFVLSRSIFVVACAASVAMHIPTVQGSAKPQPVAVVWPTTWHGTQLVPAPLDAGTERFGAQFPGAMALFDMGGASVLLRVCTTSTRALHPAEECYRGTGWRCSPLPPLRDEHGHVWSRFRAVQRDGSMHIVKQCYFAISTDFQGADLDAWVADVPSWADASSWYWAAARPGSGVVRTLAVTCSE